MRTKLIALVVAAVFPLTAQAASYCHETAGGCFEVPPFGYTCVGIVNDVPCPTPTPTPTPAPTATATPTPAPGSPLWHWMVKGYTFPAGLPNGWNYGQWLALNTSQGELTGNYGRCCTDTGEGEILATISFGRNPPQFRQWVKTYQTPKQFEIIGATPFDGTKHNIIFATTERTWNLRALSAGITFTGQAPRGAKPPYGPLHRPSVGAVALSAGTLEAAEFHDIHVGYVRYTDLNDPNPEIVFNWIVEPDTQFWPLGMVRIGGTPFLYVGRDHKDGRHDLVRYRGEPPNAPVLDPDFRCDSVPWINDIGWLPYRDTLIGVGNADYQGRKVEVYQSRDQGRTWTQAIVPWMGGTSDVVAPDGALWMCKLAKDGQGWITEPYVFTCMRSAKGGFVTDDPWLPFWMALPSARLQLTWGLQPVPWKQ